MPSGPLSASGCNRSITEWSLDLLGTRHPPPICGPFHLGSLPAADETFSHPTASTTVPVEEFSGNDHSQSPHNETQSQRIDDGLIIAGVLRRRAPKRPSNQTLVVQEVEDGRFWWLSDRRPVHVFCPGHQGLGQTITAQHSGCPAVDLCRPFVGAVFDVSSSDPHHLDAFGVSQVRPILTTGSKIAEHGGDNPSGRNLPVVVVAPGTVQPGHSGKEVEATPVAPRSCTYSISRRVGFRACCRVHAGLARPWRQGIAAHLPELRVPAPSPRPMANPTIQ
jgi:hypothetical protein